MVLGALQRTSRESWRSSAHGGGTRWNRCIDCSSEKLKPFHAVRRVACASVGAPGLPGSALAADAGSSTCTRARAVCPCVCAREWAAAGRRKRASEERRTRVDSERARSERGRRTERQGGRSQFSSQRFPCSHTANLPSPVGGPDLPPCSAPRRRRRPTPSRPLFALGSLPLSLESKADHQLFDALHSTHPKPPPPRAQACPSPASSPGS